MSIIKQFITLAHLLTLHRLSAKGTKSNEELFVFGELGSGSHEECA